MATTRKIRILLAEDDPSASERLGAMLTHSGYDVTYASDGEETLQKAEGIDIILMDMQMPKIDGGEAARTLTKYNKSSTPIIAVTAKKMTPGLLERLGMSDYEQKPINFSRLRGAIQRVLATRTPAFA